MSKRALCWIRRDLRLSDHSALAEATDRADEVAVVFVFDPNILGSISDKDNRRVTFIHQSLSEIDGRLRERGSMLLVRHGSPAEEIPKLAKELSCKSVFAARDYDPSAIERDSKVKDALQTEGIEFGTSKDSVILEGGEVLSQSGNPFRVYSPYARAWRSAFTLKKHGDERNPNLGRLMSEALLKRYGLGDWSLASLGFVENNLWLVPGEFAGYRQLEAFRLRISEYDKKRDFPAVPGTSGISVHLRFGTVSIREAVRLAMEVETPGADKWLGELIWRDFYQDILFHNPEVISKPFQSQFEKIDYPGLERHFEAWRTGTTGFPIVDAAMRCFNATGWMHNRLRMVVASFLTKDLLLDYRQGESYFARYLLDYDLASNNGGWQWAASVGADPQPYFRIFNPLLQSKKFDPGGDFIKKWVPELNLLCGDSLHCPSEATSMELAAADVELGSTYPFPIVDHGIQREKAIALLAAAKSN